MPHNKEHEELLSLLQGDDRFKFSRDVGSLGQSFDSTFDLGEGSPITRTATPPASRSLNDERKDFDFLIPRAPTFAGALGLFEEFSDFGRKPFDPPLRQNPANVTGEPRQVPGAPLAELPTNPLGDPQLRGSPSDPSSPNQGTNTPEIALLLSSLGVAIGGDSIGGRIAGAAQQFAQQRVTANLSEKILSGEKLTAKDLLGLDPKTALQIRASEAAEDRAEKEFELKERSAGQVDRQLGQRDVTEERLTAESESRTQFRDEQFNQLRANFLQEQSFNPQAYAEEAAKVFGLDLGGTDFSQLGLEADQLEGIFKSLIDVREAGLNRQATLNAAQIRASSSGGGGTAQERMNALIANNPASIPFFKATKQEFEDLLAIPEDQIGYIDDPIQRRSLQQAISGLNERLLILGEDPREKSNKFDTPGGPKEEEPIAPKRISPSESIKLLRLLRVPFG